MNDLDELVERLQGLVNRASQELSPTQDLAPILAIVKNDVIRYRVIDPALFGPALRDDLYHVALPKLIGNIEPDMAAMVVMLHYYQVDDLKTDEHWEEFKKAIAGKIDHTELTEGVLIAAYSRDEESLWVSELTRFADEPPLLSLWTTLPDQIYSETITALRTAMHGEQEDGD